MVPVESVFMRFPRMVRDIAAKLGKQVDLQIKGEDTELDRTVVEALGDPLVHLVRNAMDHGLETPEQRIASGKPALGTLEISAEHAGGEVVIRVREDGRGVDPAKVGAIAAAARADRARGGGRADVRGGRRAAVPARLLDRRGDDGHLGPRRRHGRGARPWCATSAATA